MSVPSPLPAPVVDPVGDRGAAAKHVVTFRVRGCEGCELRVGHASADHSEAWRS